MKLSAAGVCLRERDGQIEILLVRSSKGNWIFPKGKIEPGEYGLAAAMRETEEEAGVKTGQEGELPPGGRLPLGVIGKGDERIEAYSLGWARTAAPGKADHASCWMPLVEARKRIRIEQPAEVGAAMSRIIDEALFRLGLAAKP